MASGWVSRVVRTVVWHGRWGAFLSIASAAAVITFIFHRVISVKQFYATTLGLKNAYRLVEETRSQCMTAIRARDAAQRRYEAMRTDLQTVLFQRDQAMVQNDLLTQQRDALQLRYDLSQRVPSGSF
jgi:hypothetical protein